MVSFLDEEQNRGAPGLPVPPVRSACNPLAFEAREHLDYPFSLFVFVVVMVVLVVIVIASMVVLVVRECFLSRQKQRFAL